VRPIWEKVIAAELTTKKYAGKADGKIFQEL